MFVGIEATRGTNNFKNNIMVGKVKLLGERLVIEHETDKNLSIMPRQLKEFNLKEGDVIWFNWGSLYSYIDIVGFCEVVEKIGKEDKPILKQLQDNIYEGKYDVYFKNNNFHRVFNWGRYECYKSKDTTDNFNKDNLEVIKYITFVKH